MPYFRKYTAAQKRAFYRRMAKGKAMAKKPKTAAKKAAARTRNKNIVKVVKTQLDRRIERHRNAKRSLFEIAQSAPNFGGAAYWLGNIGGQAAYAGASFTSMATIAAERINAGGGAVSATNQAYIGKEIFGKYFRSQISLCLPGLRQIPTGGADFEQIPQQYNYRAIWFRAKDRPATSQTQSGLAQRPAYSLFSNTVGTKFGPLTDPGFAVPDLAGVTQWVNNDLYIANLNRTNYHILQEKRGTLSLSQTLTATANNSSVTGGTHRYPSEVQLNFYLPINKKLQMQLTNQNPATPPAQPLVYPLNYNTSIGVMIILNPVGEQPNLESTWNDNIQPYIHINNEFVFTDP